MQDCITNPDRCILTLSTKIQGLYSLYLLILLEQRAWGGRPQAQVLGGTATEIAGVVEEEDEVETPRLMQRQLPTGTGAERLLEEHRGWGAREALPMGRRGGDAWTGRGEGVPGGGAERRGEAEGRGSGVWTLEVGER